MVYDTPNNSVCWYIRIFVEHKRNGKFVGLFDKYLGQCSIVDENMENKQILCA